MIDRDSNQCQREAVQKELDVSEEPITPASDGEKQSHNIQNIFDKMAVIIDDEQPGTSQEEQIVIAQFLILFSL